MFIANDSNYTFGKFLAVENGDDIKAPVYSKCFTDTEALKGYRFVHDPEETDPEKCVCFSIYDDVSSEATSTAFGKDAVVSDLTSVSFRLDTKILDSGKVRDVPYYHVIVPVQNIKDDTLKYLVIKMTKEVELFPENYPYYELVSTFADAEPTSAEAPGSVTPTGTITITENDTYDVTNYASAVVNVSGGSSDFSTAEVTLKNLKSAPIVNYPLINIYAEEETSEEDMVSFVPVILPGATVTKTAVLYKSKVTYIDMDEYNITHVTGDITYSNGTLTISGAGTIEFDTEA